MSEIVKPSNSLLEFLQEGYNRDATGKNYVNKLLAISSSKTIEEMIKLYSDVFRHIPRYIFGNDVIEYEKHVPDTWGSYSFLAFDLGDYLNCNILRWYSSLENPIYEQLVLCIINLQDSFNKEEIQAKLLKKNIGADIIGINKIIEDRDCTRKIRLKMMEYPKYSNYARNHEKEYYQKMRTLLSLGYKKTALDSVIELRNNMYIYTIKDYCFLILSVIIGITIIILAIMKL